MDQESEYSLVGCLWLRVSQKASIELLAELRLNWGTLHSQAHSCDCQQVLDPCRSWPAISVPYLMGHSVGQLTVWQLASFTTS